MALFTPGTVLASRYKIVSELGRGGMGVVYLVEHVHTGKELALKVLTVDAALSESSIERFKREARAPARINSENVVTVTDADVLPDLGSIPFFVMERLHGRDLEAEVAARGKLPAAEVVSWLAQAARALDRAHVLGVIHRDLKPENLFIHEREDGTTCLKILDFGISKIVDGASPEKIPSLTGPGSMVGTPFYMSPEQASDAQVTHTTDVWSLGLVAVRLLTGEVYWRAKSLPDLMAQLVRDPLYAPSKRWPWLPAAFDAWFEKSCHREPHERFASVGTQIEELARVFDLPAPPRLATSTPVRMSDRSSQASPAARSVAVGVGNLLDSEKGIATSTMTQSARSRKVAIAFVAVAAAIGGGVIVAPRLFPASTPVGIVATGPSSAAATPASGSGSGSASGSGSGLELPRFR